MESIRTVYRCTYAHKDSFPAGPVRDSRAFMMEREARACADALKARGYAVHVWRMREVKVARRWDTDLDSELTQVLDS